ncbi:EAL domain-containing protein [Yoonia sp. BS5-3]|uniref:Bifunctional diguanylate cyclase/phosphodiesterase n=1 Tax=Yoonia phaeophyticola TaxID=3137369 RepID=A0ABZ2V4G2_9RHOB
MKFFLRAVAFGGVVIALIAVIIWFSVNTAVDRVIARDAVDKAHHWGDYAVDSIPDLTTLVQTGLPNEEQREVIRKIRVLGDVFRFKLFDAQGRLSLVSDETNIIDPDGIAAIEDPEPMQVAQTGIPIIEVFDGTAKPDRPDLYAEAYIPLTDDNGQVVGVVEVYVNQTAKQTYFQDSFRTFGLMLIGFITIVFTGPMVAFWLQRILTRRSEKTAEFLARFDPLTGLQNRREFMFQAAELAQTDHSSVLCFIDLDNFKSINDKHGHAGGDSYLVHVSDVLRKNCRNGDLLARLGGDEFVIIFRDTEIGETIPKIRSILAECAAEIEIEASRLQGSVSIGVAALRSGDDLDQILSNADAALYHVKASGRNDFAVYGKEMGEERRKRHALETRLRKATAECDFELHYQPLVGGKDGEVIGYEALLRLSDEKGEPIPPSIFIPLAEELGLIDDIGRWVINTATQTMALCAKDRTLAINISTVQFQSGELINIVKDALRASGFPARHLELEITESLLLEDSTSVEMQIDTLKDMGIALAMDDFGTGFSSLSYLWKYGFDRLKIDRSFVTALEYHPDRSREIIETVVLLGSKLGMKITAEGVETAAQADLLSVLGCDVLQGYHFGLARPADVIAAHTLPDNIKAAG